KPEHTIVDHFTYVLASDGDLMEGIASEAGSMAGHLGLGKLVVLYADNHITIEGNTDIAFTEDRCARFAAFGWHVQNVADGNDIEAVTEAIQAAREKTDQPSLIAVRTHIGYGSPHKQDSASAHGEPLGVDEVRLTKERLGWPAEPDFHLPQEALDHFRQTVTRGKESQAEWEEKLAAYGKAYPELAEEFNRIMSGKLPADWDASLPTFTADSGALATRAASGKCINAIAPKLPELMGGSADLAPSTQTLMDGVGAFQPDDLAGRNMHFGIREHSMGAILNGMAYHRGMIPYGATFLVFSDYMRPPMRLAAINHLPVIYVFTHDSIGMGEDGPTHQPIEQLVCLRSVPNLFVVRPADANETAAAWRIAVERQDGPVALILTRQKLPILDLEQYQGLTDGVAKGGYVLSEAEGDGAPDLILVGTGSEVHLALEAQKQLAGEGVRARVVSLPCWELFAKQPEAYRHEVVTPGVPLLGIEAGSTLGWETYFDSQTNAIGIAGFGASAPGEILLREYGFTVENVCQRAKALLK
ncbi:MAG: transketolase, partial [Planctomycetaceae bacterium]|nr:transketolase [Planctomycetaceae bacterium]